MKQRFIWSFIAFSSLLALISCGGSGTSSNNDTTGSSGGGSTTTTTGGGTLTGSVTVSVEPSQQKEVRIGHATVLFPADAFSVSTTVTLRESTAPSVAQPTFKAIQPLLTLQYTSPLQRPLTVTYPDTSNQEIALVAAFDGHTAIGAFPSQKQNGAISISVDPAQLEQGRSVSLGISLVLGLLTLHSVPDSELGLRPVGAMNPGRVVVYVHGLLQSVASDKVKTAVNSAQISGGYGSAYVFSYDYRLSFRQAGLALAAALTNAQFADKSVDIVAYSKGGLIARTALEEVGVTKSVRRVIFLGTPNKGCSLALTALYSMVASQFLSSPNPLVFPAWSDDWLAELLPNSPALNELNQYRFKQNGLVDYWFFSGAHDGAVAINSAYATDLPIGDLTNGQIHHTTLADFDHRSLGGAMATSQAVSQVSNSGKLIWITSSPEPAQPKPITESWQVAIQLTNNTGQGISLETVQLEEFDRDGQWQGNYWFDPATPPGIFFPRHRLVWSTPESRMTSGQTKTLYVEYWPDENKTPVSLAVAHRQARTSHVIVSANGDDGRHYAQEHVVHLAFGDIYPAEPQTRSRGRSTGSAMPMARFK